MSALLPIALALAAGEVEPPSPPPKPSVITNPEWLRRPSGEDIARYYPAAAIAKNLGGSAVLTCGVNASGLLHDCSASGESPPGEGFGEAVLRMAPLFKLRPTLKDGQPVGGGAVRIPIRFVLPDGTIDPMTILTSCYGEMGAQVQKTPTDEEAANAYGFFAAQVALRSAQARTPPASFELSLTHARQVALEGRTRLGLGLSTCRRVYKEGTQAARPPT